MIMDEEEQTVHSQRTQKAKYPCLRCKKNVAKNSKSVRCGTCQFWVHVDCEGITNELYQVLAHPEKFGGNVTWTCDSCQASAAQIDQVVKAYIERIKDVEKRVSNTESGLKDLDRKVEKMDEKMKGRDDKVEKRIQKGEENVFEEMREREARRANVVMYKVKELEDEKATGRERIDWDKKMCRKIFSAMELEMKEEDVKFCRRIGERGEEPRPLVVGFFSEIEKGRVLRRAKNLDKTRYKEVNICQDLTRRQRMEEEGMRKEAERKNEELTEEDKSKNLRWAVVGARGEKRLIKTTAREQGTGYGTSQRGGGTTRGRTSEGTRTEGRRNEGEGRGRRKRSEDEEEGPTGKR